VPSHLSPPAPGHQSALTIQLGFDNNSNIAQIADFHAMDGEFGHVPGSVSSRDLSFPLYTPGPPGYRHQMVTRLLQLITEPDSAKRLCFGKGPCKEIRGWVSGHHPLLSHIRA
jgi:hypothetical protein